MSTLSPTREDSSAPQSIDTTPPDQVSRVQQIVAYAFEELVNALHDDDGEYTVSDPDHNCMPRPFYTEREYGLKCAIVRHLIQAYRQHPNRLFVKTTREARRIGPDLVAQLDTILPRPSTTEDYSYLAFVVEVLLVAAKFTYRCMERFRGYPIVDIAKDVLGEFLDERHLYPEIRRDWAAGHSPFEKVDPDSVRFDRPESMTVKSLTGDDYPLYYSSTESETSSLDTTGSESEWSDAI